MKAGEFFDGTFDEISKNKRLAKLKKRKLYQVKNQIYYTITKGTEFSDKIKVLKFDLTMDDIVSGNWKDPKDFKAMNLNSKGNTLDNGGLHPLMKMRTAFREILVEMGFNEMRTNRFVESSFWNFDSLFQP